MRKLIFPILLGLSGCAVLMSLGFWQVDRLGQKQAYLAEIEARIIDAPVALPDDTDESRDKYLPVTVTGQITDEHVYMLAPVRGTSPGYRVVSVMLVEGRRLLVDRGFITADLRGNLADAGQVTYRGNLHWPQEADKWTPAQDGDLIFARNVGPLAAALNAENVMIVVADHGGTDPQLTPMPVGTSGISNDHKEYAITWFMLAAVWALMTGYLIFRTLQAKES
ncbi:SURF1 family protein [Aestuariibius sp. HNIBRBA575]|uniref:SURF1 family protein n=1 Tax=Aestuariibius sp. HNIBRBA575 TaxID=3233343 RepID=UPI0034A23BE1